jgi:predicted esterase
LRRTTSALACALLWALSACSPRAPESANQGDPWIRGRLAALPETKNNSAPRKVSSGLFPVFAGKPDDAWVYAPASAAKKANPPLLLLLHGAGGSGSRFITRFTDLADQTGIILVAPKSAGVTWDAMNGPIGVDVEKIDRVVRKISDSYGIDPTRVSVAGFSDGATYALALGRLNGTLFRNIVAFSPGILIPVAPRGSPPIFISHGTLDTILPIDITSRRFVPELKREGYSVEYHEFDGPHAVPPDIAALAMSWISAH